MEFWQKAVPVVLILAGCCSVSLAEKRTEVGPAAEPERESQILFADSAQEHPIFIPQRLLERTPVDELPISTIDRNVLKSEVKKFSAEHWGYRCNSAEAQERGKDDRTYSFEDYLRLHPVVVTGRILELVPGWSAQWREVATAAYVEVDEVIWEKKPGTAPATGTVVGVVFPGGRTVVGRTPLCQDGKPGFYQPIEGDRVALAGRYLSKSPPFFEANSRFPIVDEEVLAQPLSALSSDQHAAPLQELRQELRVNPKGGKE